MLLGTYVCNLQNLIYDSSETLYIQYPLEHFAGFSEDLEHGLNGHVPARAGCDLSLQQFAQPHCEK